MGDNQHRRIDFVDLTKGVCIILVVMAHVGGAFEQLDTNSMLSCFRMPLYFFISVVSGKYPFRKLRVSFILFIRISSCVFNQFANLIIKCFCFHQLLQSEMHPVSPVVSWIGWNINSLFRHIRISPFPVYR